MSSAATKKVQILVESAAEQQETIKNQHKTLKAFQGIPTHKENRTGRPQLVKVKSAAKHKENIKNQRKTLKVLQGVATDKEILTGRAQLDKLSRLKADADEIIISTNASEYAKRKKIEAKTAETQTSPDSKSSNKRIKIEDLCSDEKPSEYYFERLAEKRREALEQTSEENQRLCKIIEGLEEELNTSRQQLEEGKHLVSVLTKMLSEGEATEELEKSDETEGEGVAVLSESGSDS